jgi:ADP-ribose pyrophosphatase YjhB (NUDIX family)
VSEVWKPSVTVAAVMERAGRFCLVEEEADGRLVFNQPAGHWEAGETLAAACAREALEETAHHFRPTGLLGVYRWHYAPRDATFLRFAFVGRCSAKRRAAPSTARSGASSGSGRKRFAPFGTVTAARS